MASNTLELRMVHQRENGQTVRQWLEYRTKDTVITLLGVPLGSWSGWQAVEVVTVDQNGDPL